MQGETPLAFAHNAESLSAVRVWNLTTMYGDLDISFVPSGTGGYVDLVRDSSLRDVDGVRVRMASLADIIRSKQAANRPKDQRVLPVLREILATRRERGGPASASRRFRTAEVLAQEVDLEQQEVLGDRFLRGHVRDAGQRQHNMPSTGSQQLRRQPEGVRGHDVVVGEAVDEHQRAFELAGPRQRRGRLVRVRVLVR